MSSRNHDTKSAKLSAANGVQLPKPNPTQIIRKGL
jgi:hypothetical protein